VTFTNVATSGVPVLDELVSALKMAILRVLLSFQFAAHSEYNGLYTETPVPNPDLVALGAKFGTMEEFMEEVKKHF